MSCFTSTLGPEVNVLSQKSRVRVFACKTCVRQGRLYELPDVAVPATLCSTDTSCESVSAGFAFGNFCRLLLPCLLQHYRMLLRAFSSVLFYGNNALLAHTERVCNLSKQRCWWTLPCLKKQRSAGHSCHFLPHLTTSWWCICWKEWFSISNVIFFFLNRIFFLLPHRCWSLPACVLTWYSLHYSDWLSSELQCKIIDLMN